MDNEFRWVFVRGSNLSEIINSAFIVLLLAPADPLTPNEDWGRSMVLFVERGFEPPTPSLQAFFETKIEVYLKDRAAKEKGIPPGTRPLAKGTHTFTTEDNVEGRLICRKLGVA